MGVGVYLGDELVGVGILGRPTARNMPPGTAEITRVTTLGTPNACSMLYGALTRAAKALGYKRVITYTLESEPGTSLRAAGFVIDHRTKDQTWDRPSRPRQVGVTPLGHKLRWTA